MERCLKEGGGEKLLQNEMAVKESRKVAQRKGKKKKGTKRKKEEKWR